MPATLRQCTALVGLSATELLRQPVCFLLTFASVALTVLLPMAASVQLGQQGHLARDGALASELVFGVLLAGYASCVTLHNECLSGTILTVLSKPVSRSALFLAKFLAVTTILLLFILESTAATLLGTRLSPVFFELDTLGMILVLVVPLAAFLPAAALNFYTGRSFVFWGHLFLALALILAVVAIGFVDREGQRIPFGSLLEWRLAPACCLEGLGLFLLAAIALSLATRLNTSPTVVILTVILFAGLISNYLISRIPQNQALIFALRTVLPDMQSFWPADRLMGDGAVGFAFFRRSATYAALYTTGVLCLGLVSFRNRQF
ncbi:MAG: hypothetical protein WCS01_03090 [bacterium]